MGPGTGYSTSISLWTDVLCTHSYGWRGWNEYHVFTDVALLVVFFLLNYGFFQTLTAADAPADHSGTEESVVASSVSSPEPGQASDHHLLKFVLKPPVRRAASLLPDASQVELQETQGGGD